MTYLFEFQKNIVDAAILVFFAEKQRNKLKEELGELKKSYKIEALYGKDLYSKILELVTSSGYEFKLD